jgi:hypothetical protein
VLLLLEDDFEFDLEGGRGDGGPIELARDDEGGNDA